MDESTFLGFPRWQITLAIVFLAQMLTAVGFSLVFPFLPLYVEHLGSTTGLSVEWMAGLVIAVQGLTMMFASPLWGAVADRYGRKLMVLRSMYGGVVVMALMGMVTSGEQLILLRAVQGLATGTVAANNALVASAVPRHRVGFAMGTLQVGLWAGVAIGPLVGGVLADMYGFAMPFFITAAALFVGGLLIHFGIHEDFEPQKAKVDEVKPSMLAQWRHVFGANGVSLIYFMRFLAGIGRTMIVPIAPLFVVSLLPPELASQSIYAGAVISVSSATSTFSGVYLGRLGDKIGHRTVLIGSAIVVVLFYLPQPFVSNVWQLLFLQGLAGLAMGGIIAAPSALLAHFTEPGEEGAVYGLDNAIVAASRAVAPLIGAGVAMLFGFRGTFAATAILFAIVWLVASNYLPKDQYIQLQTVAVGD
jgi:DHA1 family multidrug resistance protein-like MFS transporter